MALSLTLTNAPASPRGVGQDHPSTTSLAAAFEASAKLPDPARALNEITGSRVVRQIIRQRCLFVIVEKLCCHRLIPWRFDNAPEFRMPGRGRIDAAEIGASIQADDTATPPPFASDDRYRDWSSAIVRAESRPLDRSSIDGPARNRLAAAA